MQRISKMMLTAVILVLVAVTSSIACPPWTTYNSSSHQCQCGKKSLGGLVRCNARTLKVSVLRCYCMTYSKNLNQTFVGRCEINCDPRQYTAIETADVHLINNVTCQDFKRIGQLCGKCVEGYGPPVYSYSLSCVECSESHFKHNLFRYIAIAFGPLTLFYLLVVVFKISVTSGSMTAYVMISQVVATSHNMKEFLSKNGHSRGMIVAVTLASIWNLDILRSAYSPFCIHPKMTPLQVLALDYLVGVHPLFLIFLTYIAVSLHDRYSLVVNMWGPAYKCLSYFRKEWDIRGSLVQAFATFLVLSYVKILDVSFDLLTPVYLWNMEGKYLKQPYLYNDGEVLYFGREHLPYGVLAIIILAVFNILPVILLLVYPCSCFRKCLNCCGLHGHTLHTFMDAFQGCYGHHPRDCRYFSTLYLFLRVLSLLTLTLIGDEKVYLSFNCFYFILLAILVTCLKPYKKEIHNKCDVTLVFLALCAAIVEICGCISVDGIFCSLMRVTGTVIYVAGILYGIALYLRHLYPKKLCIRMRDRCYSFYTHTRERDTATANDVEESLPHRIQHQDKYSPLIKVA